MLDISFPTASTLYTPTDFLARSTSAQSDCERMDVTVKNGTDRVDISIPGTDEGDFFGYSLSHMPGFERLLREVVGNTGVYRARVTVSLSNPDSGESQSFTYDFVADRFHDTDFATLRDNRLPLSAAGILPRRISLDHAAPEVLSFFLYNPGGKALQVPFELEAMGDDSADNRAVNGWLTESVRNGLLSFLRFTADDASSAVADRDIAGLLPFRLRVTLPAGKLDFLIQPAGEHPVAVLEFQNRYGFPELFYCFGGWDEERKVTRKEADLGNGPEVYRTTVEQTITLRTGPLHQAERALFYDLLDSPTVTLRALGHTRTDQPFLIDSHDLKASSDPYALPEATLKLRPMHNARFAPVPVLPPDTFDKTFDTTYK